MFLTLLRVLRDPHITHKSVICPHRRVLCLRPNEIVKYYLPAPRLTPNDAKQLKNNNLKCGCAGLTAQLNANITIIVITLMASEKRAQVERRRLLVVRDVL